jgi:Tfp pilus assembly protein PilO
VIGNLSRRERALVGLSVLAALVIGGWMLVIQPIRERNQLAAERVPVRARLLAKRQELIGRKEPVRQELEATNAKIEAVSARFLTAAAPPVAASELEKLVKDMAVGATTEVRSERILPPVEHGELLEIPIEIAVSGEIRNLVDLLGRLEAAPKLMTLQDLKIRVMNMAQPKELLATLTISGYILPGKTESPGKTKT